MYNEELKTRFINSYTNSSQRRYNCLILFNKLQEYEEKWQADVCTWGEEELDSVIDKILGLRLKGSESRLVALKTYAKWCLENNFPNAKDSLINLKYSGIRKMRQEMVRDPSQLQDYLNIIFYPESRNTMDNVFRCFYWFAYSGCSEGDVMSITADDIDLQSKIIRIKKESLIEEYPIYEESIPALESCITSTSFVYIHPNYSKDIDRDRVGGNQLLRGIKTETTLSRARIEISRRSKKAVDKKETDLHLSYFRVWLSGVFYRTYELEKIGVEPNFMELAGRFMSGKNYKLDSGRNTIEAKQRAVAKEYLDDYYRWKLAFMI